MYRKTGFSLLEVLAVIVIISLLAVFGHASYVGYVQRSKVTEALSILEQYQNTALQVRARTGTIAPFYVLFTDENQNGLIAGSPSSSNATKQIDLRHVKNVVAFSGVDGDGNTYILLGAEMQDDGIFIDNENYVYLAGVQTPSGVLTWECGISASQGNTILPEYLPQTCQANLP